MEDQFDLALKHKFGNFFYYKTFFLPSVVLFPCLLIIEIYQNYYYIFFSLFTSLLILTWNFPIISRLIYSRPIYFEDLSNTLILENKEKTKIIYDIENSNKFKSKFIIFQQFIISLVIALMADYIRSRLNSDNVTPIEILGVIGGLISIMIKIIKILGKISLYIIYKQSKKEIEFDNQSIISEYIINDNSEDDIII